MVSIIFRNTGAISPIPNLTELPPEIISGMGSLITLFKAVGVVFLIYFIFLIISSYITIRRSIRIKKIYEKVNDIDKKLDKILRKSNKKEIKKSKKKWMIVREYE